MNDLIAMFILAVVQGIAEWLPISSSGHLILISHFLDYPLTLTFAIALHFGTLMAVFVYFGREISEILRDLLTCKFSSPSGKMGVMLLIASIPAGIVGYFFHGYIEQTLDNLVLLVLGLSITGVLLIIGGLEVGKKRGTPLSYKGALLLGAVEVFSLFRGISRSGSTISTGLFLGLTEKQAVMFSFLMSIPVVFGANILILGDRTLPPSYFWGALVSFIVGILTIHISLKYILTSRKNLRWIGLYVLLVALGLALYLIFW